MQDKWARTHYDSTCRQGSKYLNITRVQHVQFKQNFHRIDFATPNMWQMMKFDPWQKFPTTQYVVTTFEFGYYLMQQVVGIMFSSYRCYSECLPLNVMISWKPRNVSILDFCHCASEDLQLITSSNSGRCFHGAEVEMTPLWLSYSTESSIITLESCWRRPH